MTPRARTLTPVDQATAKGPTRRALAKQKARERVLAAARRLFSEAGYEGATIRDIAAAAGMSTGAVFANFEDKSDLFREIMSTDLQHKLQAMDAATAGAGNVEDTLVRFFCAGYDFYLDKLPMARAAFSVSLAPESGKVMCTVPALKALYELIAAQLRAAITRGELVADTDVDLRGEMLVALYLANYPRAIHGEMSPESLEARSRAQIRVILSGARKS